MLSTRAGAAVIVSVAITAAAAIAVIAGPRKAEAPVGGLALDAPLPAGPPGKRAALRPQARRARKASCRRIRARRECLSC